MRFVIVFAALALLAGCFGARSLTEDDPSRAQLAANGEAPELRPVAGQGGAGAQDDDRHNPSVEPPDPPPPGPSAGSGGCGANRDPMQPVTADTSGFTGVGGAGFLVVAICDRCGWDHSTDACRGLVRSAHESPNGVCSVETFDYVTCLERESCVCDGATPPACVDIEAKLHRCVGQ